MLEQKLFDFFKIIPDINITSVVSHNFAGQKISDIYPNLKNVFGNGMR